MHLLWKTFLWFLWRLWPVYSLGKTRWRRIRGLWKLDDGRDWLRGKESLVLMGGAVLSKSLIQFSVERWGCIFPLSDLRPNYGGDNEDNGDAFKRSHASTVTLSSPTLDYKESWALKNWCFWTVLLEKTIENPLDCKEIQPVHPKGNQPWIFIGRTDAEAEIPVLWPPDVKSWLVRKDPDAEKDWRWKEKWTIEDEMVGWHHRLNGHEFEYSPGVGDGQGGLACCSPLGRKELDTTEQQNWTELKVKDGAII